MIKKKQQKGRFYLMVWGVVLTIYVLFFVLFRIEGKSSIDKSKEQNTSLFFITLDSLHPDFAEQQARDELDDPTLMSFPNSKYGFSSVRSGEGEPPPPVLPKYEIGPVAIDALEEKRDALVGIYEDPAKKAPGTIGQPAFAKIEIPVHKKTFSSRIVWLEDGIEKPFPLKTEDILAIDKKMPQGRTVIDVIKMSASHVFFLKEKSGNDKFDAKILLYLRKKSQMLFLNDQAETTLLPEKIIVDWRLFRP